MEARGERIVLLISHTPFGFGPTTQECIITLGGCIACRTLRSGSVRLGGHKVSKSSRCMMRCVRFSLHSGPCAICEGYDEIDFFFGWGCVMYRTMRCLKTHLGSLQKSVTCRRYVFICRLHGSLLKCYAGFV